MGWVILFTKLGDILAIDIWESKKRGAMPQVFDTAIPGQETQKSQNRSRAWMGYIR